MQTMRWMAVLGAAAILAAASSFAQAQTPPAADATKPAPKAADKKKAAPDKKAPEKATAAKKAVPKKAAPKKTGAEAKKPTTYSTKTMELRDEKGNIIPTNPDAYDVSSALPGKSPPKKK